VTSLLDHVLEGFSATLFAYGPTGSGKTYSITGIPDNIIRLGSGEPSDGIVIRRRCEQARGSVRRHYDREGKQRRKESDR
jgi:phage terminase large subunit